MTNIQPWIDLAMRNAKNRVYKPMKQKKKITIWDVIKYKAKYPWIKGLKNIIDAINEKEER